MGWTHVRRQGTPYSFDFQNSSGYKRCCTWKTKNVPYSGKVQAEFIWNKQSSSSSVKQAITWEDKPKLITKGRILSSSCGNFQISLDGRDLLKWIQGHWTGSMFSEDLFFD